MDVKKNETVAASDIKLIECVSGDLEELSEYLTEHCEDLPDRNDTRTLYQIKSLQSATNFLSDLKNIYINNLNNNENE